MWSAITERLAALSTRPERLGLSGGNATEDSKEVREAGAGERAGLVTPDDWCRRSVLVHSAVEKPTGIA